MHHMVVHHMLTTHLDSYGHYIYSALILDCRTMYLAFIHMLSMLVQDDIISPKQGSRWQWNFYVYIPREDKDG